MEEKKILDTTGGNRETGEERGAIIEEITIQMASTNQTTANLPVPRKTPKILTLVTRRPR